MANQIPFKLSVPKTHQEFERYFYFRWLYLRKPLQLPLGSEQDDHEACAHHCMALDEGDDIIGVGRIHLDSSRTAQIRFMAVAPAYRRAGIGGYILDDLYEYAQINKVEKIWLKARSEVSGFYLTRGYEVKGEVESELAIPHVLMEKYV